MVSYSMVVCNTIFGGLLILQCLSAFVQRPLKKRRFLVSSFTCVHKRNVGKGEKANYFDNVIYAQ